jgi:peptidyl-prolyl cis-trans isomerase A (cyclophilin A)
VRPDNDTGATQINVLQGGLLDLSRKLPPIAHETTDKTGLLHLNGTVSLARIAVGSGSAAAFFICVGDQPSLDFGGKRNPDGQGFAAFGQVVRGMGVVRTIWGMDASGPVPLPGMQGQILTKPAPIIRACRREQRG